MFILCINRSIRYSDFVADSTHIISSLGGILCAIPEHSFASTLRVYVHQLYVVIELDTRIRHIVYCEQCQNMHM